MYEVPSVYSEGRPVDKNREEAEMLAKAFHMSVGSYFERQVQQERRIANLTVEQRKAKTNMSIFIVIGLLTFALLLLERYCLIVPLIILGIAGFFYMKLKKVTKDVELANNALRNLRPDRTLSFVSKLYVPLYLVPYTNGAIVFDSKNRGREVSINLVNMEVGQIESDIGQLNMSANRYMKAISPYNIFDVDYLQAYNESIVKEKILEKEIIDSAAPIAHWTNSDQWIRESFTFNMHMPSSGISQSLVRAYPHLISIKSNSIPTTYASVASPQMIEIVEKLRGVEAESRSSSIIDLVGIWQTKIESLLTPIEDILTKDISVVGMYNAQMANIASSGITRQICTLCLDDAMAKRDINTEYDLEKFIAEKFRASIEVMGTIPKCPRCGTFMDMSSRRGDRLQCENEKCRFEANRLIFEPPQKKAQQKIEESINVDMKELPMEGVFNLPQVSRVGYDWKCKKHRNAKYFNVGLLSDVFSHTGDNLWIEMQDPIRKSANEANRFATQNRQKWKDQNIALTPLRGIYTELEMELDKLETQLSEAQMILDSLRGVA